MGPFYEAINNALMECAKELLGSITEMSLRPSALGTSLAPATGPQGRAGQEQGTEEGGAGTQDGVLGDFPQRSTLGRSSYPPTPAGLFYTRSSYEVSQSTSRWGRGVWAALDAWFFSELKTGDVSRDLGIITDQLLIKIK